MNQNNERVFTPSNKLKSYSLKIGDIELVHDAIISMEFSYKNDSPIVMGKILINDLYDMSQLVDWKSIDVQVLYVDMKSESTEKRFRITQIKEYEHSNYKKAFQLCVQDTFSYKLKHSFLSRGFNTSIINAFQQYLDYLDLNDFDTDFSSMTTTESFTVPKSMNNLDFFINKFKMNGYYLYQNQDSICVKSLSDLSVNSLPENDGLFTNETDNQYYKNRIIASRTHLNDRERVIPKTRSLAFDVNSKKFLYESNNDKTSLSLNDDIDDIQDDVGFRDVYQQHLNFDEHNVMIRDSFLSQNGIELVVNGFKKNTLNQIYDVHLRGNVSTTETQMKGNIIMNGKYVSKRINDKIIGDSFIQKIHLERADIQSNS